MLDWLLLIFLTLYVFCIALSLSPYICLKDFQEKETEGQKKKKDRRRRRKTEDEERLKKKDKDKSRTGVDIEVSWWIADLKTDQLNAF